LEDQTDVIVLFFNGLTHQREAFEFAEGSEIIPVILGIKTCPSDCEPTFDFHLCNRKAEYIISWTREESGLETAGTAGVWLDARLSEIFRLFGKPVMPLAEIWQDDRDINEIVQLESNRLPPLRIENVECRKVGGEFICDCRVGEAEEKFKLILDTQQVVTWIVNNWRLATSEVQMIFIEERGRYKRVAIRTEQFLFELVCENIRVVKEE
jgi:hypothetical protein